MISFWRWYRWFAVLMALICLGMMAWSATSGRWGWVPVDGTFIAVNFANAAFCHWQYKVSGYREFLKLLKQASEQ